VVIDPRLVYVAMALAALGGGIYVRDTWRRVAVFTLRVITTAGRYFLATSL
jgi:hypothetical protein